MGVNEERRKPVASKTQKPVEEVGLELEEEADNILLDRGFMADDGRPINEQSFQQYNFEQGVKSVPLDPRIENRRGARYLLAH